VEPDQLRSSYDTVAESYAQKFFEELTRKPFDRDLLDVFAKRVPPGTVLDIGCGPGQIGRYLHDRGLEVIGLDLSPAMIDVARRLNPGMRFEVADMRRLPSVDGSVAGIAAFYSVIHIAREGVPAVLGEFHRVLGRGGRLLLAVHGGSGAVARNEFLGHSVPFEATLFEKEELVALVKSAGFGGVEATARPAYEFENQTPRLYIEAARIG
jgi:SAM-dependent methyltransferase